MSRNADVGTLSELSVDRYNEFCRMVLLLCTDPDLGKCIATRAVVDIAWYEHYIASQANMMLTCDMELPEDILGMVIVRDTIVDGRGVNLFLICVRPGLDGIVKQFTIAHELGHVLMHGGLLHPGMILPERMWDYSRDREDCRLQMEFEANIYAQLSVVPTSAIERLQAVVGGGDLMPETLQEAMSWLRDEPFPLSLARERLILHHVVAGSRNACEEFRKHIWNRRTSWSINGAASMRGVVGEKPGCQLLTESQLASWKSSLEFETRSARRFRSGRRDELGMIVRIS